MKKTKLVLAVLAAFTSVSSAANIVYSGTALSNLQGSVAGDLTAGKLGLIIADVGGNGFTGATDLAITTTTSGLDVGGFWGNDRIIARVSSAFLSDATLGGGFTWNATVFPVATKWAIVWFENLTTSATGFAPGNTKYGIARATSWETPAVEPAVGTTLTYATSPSGGAPHRLTLNNGGTNLGLPANADFATNGTAFTVVPEPSAALLGAIGALGLLRRRRI
jgi:hypothetical protein